MPASETTYLVWKGGRVADFELELEFRIEGGNSGVQFRSRETSRWQVDGYQADIEDGPSWTGCLYEQGGRGVVAERGQDVRLGPGGTRSVARFADGAELLASVRPREWNRYRIRAVGEEIELAINGVRTCAVSDRDPARRAAAGSFALQLHAGPPMRVEFRGLRLRELPRAPDADAPAPTADADVAAVEGADAPRWIWTGASARDAEQAWFRRSFELAGPAAEAVLAVSADNRWNVYVNGELANAGDEWWNPLATDVAALLRPGANAIAAWAQNEGGPAAFLAQLAVRLENGAELALATDASWRASTEEPAPSSGWERAGFEPRGWSSATELGQLGDPPWGDVFDRDGPAGSGGPQESGPPLDASAIQAPEGFAVELVHAVPRGEQGSWVSLAVAPDGRFVASDQYGDLWQIEVPPTGSAEPARVSRVPVELGEAHGLCFAFGALYAVVNHGGSYASGLYRVRDTDGDGQLDSAELLRPFDGAGEHGPHAVIPAISGDSLWVLAGNHTPLPDYVTRSRVPRHWGEDQLLPRRDDPGGHAVGVLAPGGWVARTDPDGREWELYACGLRNAYDLALGPDAELFTYDADMEWDIGLPWYRPTRICHLVSGADFGWRHGSGKWPAFYADSWPAAVDVGAGSPTGVLYGADAAFPERWRSALFAADWAYGIVHAVHLAPRGASYAGTTDVFLKGEPFPVTDMVIGRDGAMYLTTGGRNLPSALYRVRWTGEREPRAADDSPAPGAEATRRGVLERFHAPTPIAVGDLPWADLGSSDLHVRRAARMVLEHQEPATWAERVLAERDARRSVEALIALVRAAPADFAPRILARIGELELDALDGELLLDALRLHQLALIRLGPLDEPARERWIARLDRLLPAADARANDELVKLLVALEAPAAAAKGMALLRAAPSQPAAIGYAWSLRNLRSGWTDALRREYFAWIDGPAATFKGGASLRAYLVGLRADAVAAAGEPARDGADARATMTPTLAAPARLGRSHVRAWSMRALEPRLAEVAAGRSFERGRAAYRDARCDLCHRFGGEGGNQGPDLTGAAGRFAARDLLESILEPSRAISDQYQDVELVLADERVLIGRLEGEDAERVVLRPAPAGAERIEVARGEIARRRLHPISRMPAGLVDVLGEDELLDLIAYVLSGGDPLDARFERGR